ncbi:MAG: hypothetical protein PW734_01430 [Verrucomicrobium sp.]|nr:hypothetical protein [Verrucomicrobium sp.]
MKPQSISAKIKADMQARAEKILAGHTPTPTEIAPSITRAMATLCPPEVFAQNLLNLMTATKRALVNHQVYGDVPDWSAREAGAKMYASYMIGLPIQRQEIVSVQKESLDTIRERLENSPAMRKSLQAVLDQAAAKAAKKLNPSAPDDQMPSVNFQDG